MYLLYSLLTVVGFILVSPYFLYQVIRYKKYVGSLRQRLGQLPIAMNVDGEESIWIHAVSVGEALTTRALVSDLKARYPRLRLFLSTTTIAGYEVARRNLPQVDAVFYFPFDWAFIVRRTLNIVKPRVFLMMETEIWPNLLRLCKARGVKTAMVNGRISPRSYSRYRLIRPFFRRVGAAAHRARRRPRAHQRDRQPQVRLARDAVACRTRAATARPPFLSRRPLTCRRRGRKHRAG
jgi:3-deoxy-D-manno-octulosonic-acid transferase